MRNKIRHLYDLHHILGDKETAEFVKTNTFFKVLDAVIECDKAALPDTPWCEEPLGSALLFAKFEAIWPDLRGTYYNEFAGLVFDTDLPDRMALERTVELVHERLSAYDTRS